MLIYGRKDICIPWICNKLDIRDPGKCEAIGIEKDGLIIGVALYNNYYEDFEGKPLCIEMSFTTIDRSWATRANIYALLGYPFFQLRVKRVQLNAAKRDSATRKFNLHMGFKYEGTARQAWYKGGDMCVYSMLRDEFIRSRWNINGKQIGVFTTSSGESSRSS